MHIFLPPSYFWGHPCHVPSPARVTPEESLLARILKIFMQTVTLIRPLFVVFYVSRHFNSTTTLVLKLSSIHPPEFCSTREKSDSWLHIINREMLLFNFTFSALMNTNYVMQIRLDRPVFCRHTIIPVQPCPGTSFYYRFRPCILVQLQDRTHCRHWLPMCFVAASTTKNKVRVLFFYN